MSKTFTPHRFDKFMVSSVIEKEVFTLVLNKGTPVSIQSAITVTLYGELIPQELFDSALCGGSTMGPSMTTNIAVSHNTRYPSRLFNKKYDL